MCMSACIRSAAVPLVEASHVTKFRVGHENGQPPLGKPGIKEHFHGWFHVLEG